HRIGDLLRLVRDRVIGRPWAALYLCALATLSSCAPAVVPPATQPEKANVGPIAERPIYELGEKWIRTDGVYDLIRIEGERYIFPADRGREIHLTKGLGLTKIIASGVVNWELLPPPSLDWPLTVGAHAEGKGIWRASGDTRPWEAMWRWDVESAENLTVP